jgi:PhzF family phenazine biosynthesis protein
MAQKISIVDAFTDKPFCGNPAAVCLLDAPISETRMKQIAAEINLSETAFLMPEEKGYRLRWFTPTSEVKLCGHATLASAHVLWEQKITSAEELEFYTLSGILTARKCKEGTELNFPVEPVESVSLPEGMIEAIGAEPIYTGKTEVRYLVELDTAERVRSLKPNISKILDFPPGRIVVTARSDDPHYDFISRYFAPGVGIPEDPVTGSTHCALAFYWAEKLKKKDFLALQASPRGGVMKAILDGERVRLIGKAVTVMQSTFEIDISDTGYI